MNKGLLVEYMPFKPIGSMNEQMGAKFGVPGGLVVQGVLQRAGSKRLYRSKQSVRRAGSSRVICC